eukprot:369103_1
MHAPAGRHRHASELHHGRRGVHGVSRLPALGELHRPGNLRTDQLSGLRRFECRLAVREGRRRLHGRVPMCRGCGGQRDMHPGGQRCDGRLRSVGVQRYGRMLHRAGSQRAG